MNDLVFLLALVSTTSGESEGERVKVRASENESDNHTNDKGESEPVGQ